MENLQLQLDEVNALIEAEKAKGAQKNQDELNRLEQQQAVILMQMDDTKIKQENEAAKMVRIQDQEVKREGYILPTDLNNFFSSESHRDADGHPYIVTNANRLVLQIVKDALTGNDDEHNARYADLESKYNTVKKNSDDKDQVIETLRQQLSQTVIERDDAFTKRDAAMEEKKQRDAQESADLTKLLADENAEKERKAAEDRAKRTVYDVVPDNDINPKNYTAKLVSTGEIVTFNWTTKNYYTVITDGAEVERFRQQHAEQSAVPNLALDTTDKIQPIPEVTAPGVQFQGQEEIHTGAGMDSETPSEDGQAQAKTLEERIALSEARLDRLEKQANLPELQVAV